MNFQEIAKLAQVKKILKYLSQPICLNKNKNSQGFK